MTKILLVAHFCDTLLIDISKNCARGQDQGKFSRFCSRSGAVIKVIIKPYLFSICLYSFYVFYSFTDSVLVWRYKTLNRNIKTCSLT